MKLRINGPVIKPWSQSMRPGRDSMVGKICERGRCETSRFCRGRLLMLFDDGMMDGVISSTLLSPQDWTNWQRLLFPHVDSLVDLRTWSAEEYKSTTWTTVSEVQRVSSLTVDPLVFVRFTWWTASYLLRMQFGSEAFSDRSRVML